MMQLHDLDIQHLKDIPGYKAILKAVIKSQIQQLVEQLADHTGEESVILTASVSDGTLCNLGSSQGKNFLDGRDEIKSQFLRYCLKRTQRKKQTDSQSGILKEPGGDGDPYETRGPRIPEPRVPTMHQPVSHPSQRVHPHPVAISKVGGQGQSYIDRGGRGGFPGESPKRSFPSSSPHRQDHHTPLKHGRVSLPAESLPSSYSDINPSHSRSPITSTPSSRTAIPPTSSNVNIQKIDLSNPANVKLESPSFQDIVESESNEGSSSHGALQDQINQDVSTEGFQGLTSPAEDSSHAHGFGGEETDTATTTTTGALDNSSNPVDAAQVKIEPITESEMELEITGVEMATRNIDDSYNNESWMSGRLGYGQQASGEDSEASGEANQSGMGQKATSQRSARMERIIYTAEDYTVTQQHAWKAGRRGEYKTYDKQTKEQIAEYAMDHGCSKAAKKFSSEFGFAISVSTIRSMRDRFIKQGGRMPGFCQKCLGICQCLDKNRNLHYSP